MMKPMLFYDVFMMISDFIIEKGKQRIVTLIYDETEIFVIEVALL
jgi:hypothetical protein